MNFIDKALADMDSLSSDDFLQAMGDIYNFPEVREFLHTYPSYIQDIINLIDYDTELQMDGMQSIIVGSLSEKYEQIYRALINCRIENEAEILMQAKKLNPDSSDFGEQIYKLENQTALYNDYDDFWDCVRNYIEENRN